MVIIAGTLLAASAQAERVRLTTGKPKKKGVFAFRLVPPAGVEQAKRFEASIQRTYTAEQKAIKIKTVVDGYPKWRANREGRNLTFQHEENGEWRDVATLDNVEDKTKEDWDKIQIEESVAGLFDFGIDDRFGAFGEDEEGYPSLVAVSTLIGDATVVIDPLARAPQIIDALFADLTGDGVDIWRTSPTSFRLFDDNPGAFISFKMTDVNLDVRGAGGTAIPEPASLALLVLGGLVALRRRRVQRV